MKKYITHFALCVLFSSCISQKSIIKKNNISSVIGEARTYIGTPYKWGGNDKVGIDCSGLMVRSFESIGIKIPRTTSQQIDLGKKVSLKKSREGDLVFFAFGKSKRKVTHVGLVSKHNSTSDIDFIHASSSRGVVETQLVKDYYLKRIRKIKRVF
ncbi:MAG: C40 family peptidase [Flammeovirgaceae bacterium]